MLKLDVAPKAAKIDADLGHPAPLCGMNGAVALHGKIDAGVPFELDAGIGECAVIVGQFAEVLELRPVSFHRHG